MHLYTCHMSYVTWQCHVTCCKLQDIWHVASNMKMSCRKLHDICHVMSQVIWQCHVTCHKLCHHLECHVTCHMMSSSMTYVMSHDTSCVVILHIMSTVTLNVTCHMQCIDKYWHQHLPFVNMVLYSSNMWTLLSHKTDNCVNFRTKIFSYILTEIHQPWTLAT